MGLFRELVESAPVGNRLPFGIVENVRIIKVDTAERKRDGIGTKQNTFITIAKVDPKTNKIVAQSEGSFWNLDPTSEYVMSNFVNQFTSLLAIAVAYGESDEQFDDDVVGVCPPDTDIEDYIRTKEGAKALQKSLADAVEKYIVPHIGLESKLLKCKSTVNKKGYYELGVESNWILPMDSEEKLATVTPIERAIHRKALAEIKVNGKAKAKPDKVGERSITTSSLPDM